MSERHGGDPVLRTFPVSASHRRSESGQTHRSLEWRESRDGLAEPKPYEPSRRARRDGDREKEVAEQVAAIRAEALRRVLASGFTPEYGLGPDGTWERLDETEATA